MLGGVSSDTTRSIVQYIYEAGFIDYRFGYSSAISYIFFFFIVIIGLGQALITARRNREKAGVR
jgi:multiple sugar transport system permease protein/raffinose/stachyose/melibiose transport system permease protein